MDLLSYFLIFLLKCICCKGALLLWSNKKLSISALREFNNNEFEQLMEDLGNPETFIFKNPSAQLQKELKTVIQHYHSAYSPNGELHFENVTELLDDGPLDVMKIEQTLDDPDRTKNIISVIILPNNIPRHKRDTNEEGENNNEDDDEDETNDENREENEKANKETKPQTKTNPEQENELKDNENKNKNQNENENINKNKNKEKINEKPSGQEIENGEEENENNLKEKQDKGRKKPTGEEDEEAGNERGRNAEPKQRKEPKSKPFEYKKPEGPVMYLKKSTKNDLYTLLYSSKPLLLKLKGGEDILLGNTSEDMITVDSRLNINIPLENGKITLRFSFSKLYGYWSLTSVKITGTQKDLNLNLNATSDITAAIHFSYHCSDKTVFTDAKKENALYLYDMQVQIDARKPRFSDAADCVNFTTVPIWSGLFVTALLGLGLVVALTAMLDIKTMDKFDNQKTKQLTITVFE